MKSRSRHWIRFALAPVVCGLAAASAMAATVNPAPVVDTTALARLSMAPPMDRAPGGRPVSQSTWCKATGLGPTVKRQPGSAASYGPSVRLRTQIGPCSTEMPAP